HPAKQARMALRRLGSQRRHAEQRATPNAGIALQRMGKSRALGLRDQSVAPRSCRPPTVS
ncbi:MAG: hypothetical protein WBF31_01075, partial [Anaerolineae bacterium]